MSDFPLVEDSCGRDIGLRVALFGCEMTYSEPWPLQFERTRWANVNEILVLFAFFSTHFRRKLRSLMNVRCQFVHFGTIGH